MTFAYPHLAALGLAPLVVVGVVLWTRSARADGRAAFVRSARGGSTWPAGALRAVIAAIAFAVAAAVPQWGHGWVETPARGLDVVVVLDASKSMRARDLAPSRLERAWSEIDALADARGPWRLGLVRFRGDAEVVSPLTDDHAGVAWLARESDPESVPGTGSGLARGVRAALEAFDDGADRRRAVLLLTDGEVRHDEDVALAIAAARARAITTIGLVIGTSSGAPVPRDDAFDAPPLLDERGAAVMSRAQVDVLEAFATATNGRVLDLAADPFAMRRIVEDELRPRMPTFDGLAREWRPIDRSTPFVVLGLLVLVPWWTLLARRTRHVRLLATAALLGCVPWVLGADDAGELARRANDALARGSPSEAVPALEALTALRPTDAAIAFDLGLARLRSGAYAAARTAFQRAADHARGTARAAALHGVALACANGGRLELERGGDRLAVAESSFVEARAALVAALADFDDDAVRSNLDVVTFWLERVRAERESAPPGQGAGTDADSVDAKPDPSAASAAGASSAPSSTSGAAPNAVDASSGTAGGAGERAGSVQEDSGSPRLPGGMFRTEADSIVEVVRRFERERRAFDRERAASAGPRGGNDW
ncbi:MAG: VWA domain-containing protein [Planctomycetes bacterium]|nr:VWA domain-containing protein [Planctomycetota bacterium]